ncbi:hypothetical protein EUTSA_v10022862mg [Eutrema salsugineum]|uniref:Uncharacterized protein n=1 Tax=Eutrema salsugineum TaxID=72664 RepID=V4MEI3_EUTSA|nr:hypothetical protein EUTSA_v10022862mg [Eutrema salsugineum]
MTFTAVRRDHGTLKAMLGSDLNELGIAAKNLANHTFMLTGLGLGTSILEWIASVAAIYLLVLDRTNWKTNMLTALLIPYIFFSLPSLIFGIFRGEIGKWIAIVAVVVQLFFPKHFRGLFIPFFLHISIEKEQDFDSSSVLHSDLLTLLLLFY